MKENAGPRWQRRISFRLASTLAVLLLAAYFLFPLVWDFGHRAFGLPTLDQEIVKLSDPDDARLLPLGDLKFIGAHLLIDGRSEGPGRWRPDPERAGKIERSLAAYDQTFAWLSTDREVMYRSEGLPFDVGDVFERDLAHPEIETAGTPFGNVLLGRVSCAIWNGGEFAGWLVIYGRPPLFGQRGDDLEGGAPGVLVEERGVSVRWSDRLANVIAGLFVVLGAVGIAALVSRLVTRRVSELAAEAAAPIESPHDLPGPFDERGGDEIAVLARAMNGMRSQVEGLLGDLERRDQDRRRWIAQVSHDLRTPLTALTAGIERAESELAAGRGAEVEERLALARHDALRLAELVEDLLDIARLEADESLVSEPVPPGELARHASRGLIALAERAGKRLEVELAPELPLLSADGRRLMRALENLLRNALHHAETRVVLRASRVVLRASRAGAAVRFVVEDDGPGLPVGTDGAVDIEGLADRRSRPDSAGLGLVVVRKVAEIHGGRMGAENAPDGGARVWFEIPV